MNTRRMFLGEMLLAGAAASLCAGQPVGWAQELPRQPQPVQLPPADFPNPAAPGKRMPEESSQETRKKVERLYQLAAELKTEVEKTDSSSVLSMDVLKKTEEIEKLAHEIRKRAKG